MPRRVTFHVRRKMILSITLWHWNRHSQEQSTRGDETVQELLLHLRRAYELSSPLFCQAGDWRVVVSVHGTTNQHRHAKDRSALNSSWICSRSTSGILSLGRPLVQWGFCKSSVVQRSTRPTGTRNSYTVPIDGQKQNTLCSIRLESVSFCLLLDRCNLASHFRQLYVPLMEFLLVMVGFRSCNQLTA